MKTPLVRLGLGAFECDWKAQFLHSDHSDFFCADDAFLNLAAIELNNGKSDSDLEEGLSRSLISIRDRLELLGYTISSAKEEFEWLAYGGAFDLKTFSFEMLYDALTTVNVDQVSPAYKKDGRHLFFAQEMAPRLELDLANIVANAEIEDLSYAMQEFSPGSILRILANNPANLYKDVVWRTHDIFRMQFATFNKKRVLESTAKFLIVTEGSTDAAILRHAFNLLMPHVADFFHYVDMDKGYPFSGTGNLFRFTQGLVSIAMENKVAVLFDNDAEGSLNFRRASALPTGQNICVLRLPDLPPDDAIFDTVGPEGLGSANINGKAAAIECYLPFEARPKIRWTSYFRDLDCYQGEIIGKTGILKKFLSKKEVSKIGNLDKLNLVLRHIISSCSNVSSSIRKLRIPDSIR